MGEYTFLAGLFALGAMIWLGFILVFLAFYVLKSLGLYTLAINRGIETPWLAWIPVADLYIMGLLVGEMDFFNYHLDNLGLWVPVIIVGGSILARIPVIGFLFSLAMFVFAIYFVFKLFEIYTPQAVIYTVLSIFCLFPIFLFIIRNNPPLSENGPSAQPPASNL
jgi:hypothetical protein